MGETRVTGATVVLIRFSSIGDLLLCEPLPRLLKARGADRVVFVTRARLSELPRGWPAVDQVLELEEPGRIPQTRALGQRLRELGPVITLDLHNTLRSRLLAPPGLSGRLPKHRLEKWLRVHGPRALAARLPVPPPVWQRYQALAGIAESEQSPPRLWVDGQCVDANRPLDPGPQAPELLVPGAGKATKRWPLDHWRAFTAALLQASPRPLVIAGGTGDRALGDTLRTLDPGRITNACGSLDLNGSARLVAGARRILCGDTGLLHMAAAAGTPGIALFGPTTRELGFFPAGERIRVLEDLKLDCRPCSHIGSDRCPRGHFRCLTDLRPERVLAAYLAH
jgi:ADP-heptose:LPS heptosyltransferase